MRRKGAVYHKPILPEHIGNPLIEALPRKVSDKEVVEALGFYPEHNETERQLETFERTEYLSRLDNFVQPLMEYLDCFRMIELAIKQSYSTRNPFSPTTNYHLNYLSHSLPRITPKTGAFQPKGSAMTVVGMSGVGKSKMLEACLNYFSQVIDHTQYEDRELPLTQLVWLNIQCPHDSSLRGLCHTILSSIDQVICPENPVKPDREIATLLDQIERRVKSCFVGIIVIDEMQNLNIGKAGGADKLLSFILNLINRCGVPILFCGNPQMSRILQSTFRNARRSESGGYIEMKNLEYDEIWVIFIEELWRLQWTNTSTPLTPALGKKLYDLSSGVVDVAVRIYKKAQEIVIGSEDERINLEVLDTAYQNACRLTDPGLSLLRSKRSKVNKAQIENQAEYDDLLSSESVTSDVQSHSVVSSKEKRRGNSLTSEECRTIPGDLSRPHHYEFSEKSSELKNAPNLHERIVDPNVFQHALSEEDLILYLKGKEVICCDPLAHFS